MRQFFNYFKFDEIFKKERSNLLALDIGPSSIKALELGKKGDSLILEKFSITPLPLGCINGHHIESYSTLTEKLSGFVKEFGYAEHDTSVILSGPQVVTQLIKVPSELADHQLMAHIESEAEKYFPFSIDELSLDFDVIEGGRDKDGYIEVLLAAAKKSYVDEYINILRASDLKIKVIDVYSCVMGRLAAHVAPKQLQDDVTNKVIAMIDIGHEILTISIFKNERQIYIKEQNFGGKVLSELIQKEHSVSYEQAEELKSKHDDPVIAGLIINFNDQLAMQAYHMLQFFYASAFAMKIDCVFIVGGGAKLPGIDKSIENKIDIVTNILDPFVGIDTDSYASYQNIKNVDSSLSAACGLALRSYVG